LSGGREKQTERGGPGCKAREERGREDGSLKEVGTSEGMVNEGRMETCRNVRIIFYTASALVVRTCIGSIFNEKIGPSMTGRPNNFRPCRREVTNNV